MLTRLRFQNWRSLRDVEITGLTPITVFIGANASGKTNTVDALRFLNYVNSPGHSGVVGGVRKWRGREKIRTAGVGDDAPVVLEFAFHLGGEGEEVTEYMELKFEGRDVPLTYTNKLFEGTQLVYSFGPRELPLPPDVSEFQWFSEGKKGERYYDLLNRYMNVFVARRWQLLEELFKPPLSISREEAEPGDLYILDQSGRNLVYILEHMQQTQPDLYGALRDDLRWLLDYVDTVGIEQGERETRLSITENPLGKKEAPSISAGTARLVAMLTAFYILDMEQDLVDQSKEFGFEGLNIPIAHMPGLVIIEEPDTALNPALLGRFVELLRTYVSGEHPRQVILTTHNPALLNFFKPEEVRVVERDENGHTTVRRIPEHIEKIWLDDYGLGEVWLTNSFGGLAI